MAILKKVNENWQPVEHPGLQVGETVDFAGPNEALVRGGMAILVDKKGNEIELPGQEFECPVCFKLVEGLQDFIEHVSKHMPKPEETVVKEKVEDSSLTATEAAKKAEEIRAKRLASLEKARATRAANKKKEEEKEKASDKEK